MKKIFKSALIIAVFGFGAVAYADPILIDDTDAGDDNGANVGGIDIVRGTTTKAGGGLDAAGDCGAGNSSAPEFEECWAEKVLGIELSNSGKNEDVVSYETTVSDVIAFALDYGPGYYIVKNSTAWVLLENVLSLEWGVLDLGDLAPGFANLRENVIISHVTELNGNGDIKIVEPGTLGLLGIGLIGLGLSRRRRATA